MSKYRLIILEILNKRKNGIQLSELINDKTLVKTQEDIDELLTEICRMCALKLIEVQEEEDIHEGKDLRLKITELGKIYLKEEKLRKEALKVAKNMSEEEKKQIKEIVEISPNSIMYLGYIPAYFRIIKE